MQDLNNKVAVVTGAASGIGRGLVERCADENMKIVAVDVNKANLDKLSADLAQRGVEHMVAQTDVADAKQVDALARQAVARFGAVDLLFNNAGVLLAGYSWERSVEDWRWLLDINVMGVINGIHSFVPIMLKQGTPAHIVNTASLAGFLAAPLMGPYTVSKQAVVALSETLHYELRGLNSNIHVSVLCPGQVATRILDSGDNRPGQSQVSGGGEEKQLIGFLKSGIDAGMSPRECADKVFRAIQGQRFWIFPHPQFKPAYQRIVDSVMRETNPVYQPFEISE